MLYQQAAAVQPGQQQAESPASLPQPASAAGSPQHWLQCCSWAAEHLLPLGTRALVEGYHLCLSCQSVSSCPAGQIRRLLWADGTWEDPHELVRNSSEWCGLNAHGNTHTSLSETAVNVVA